MKSYQLSIPVVKDLLLNRSASDAGESTHLPQPTSALQPKSVSASHYQQLLSVKVVDVKRLRETVHHHGIPSGTLTASGGPQLRQVIWKLLLGYLPPETSAWEKHLAKKRSDYLMYCEELVLEPEKFAQQHASNALPTVNQDESCAVEPIFGHEAADLSLMAAAVEDVDHPLSLNRTSRWATYFKDAEVLEQIDRDVLRTRADMHFFSANTAAAAHHRKEMKRALFLYAKLNPGLNYVQGMNELFAPLYYICKSDRATMVHAEADAFYCFMDLMSDLRDNFCQQLDNSNAGIQATLATFAIALERHDPCLAQHMKATGLKPYFYAFRWITLLFTQEFPLPDLLRIWDFVLSDPHGRMDCVHRICLGMLTLVRDTLLASDMATSLKLLQHFPHTNIDDLLGTAASYSGTKAWLIFGF